MAEQDRAFERARAQQMAAWNLHKMCPNMIAVVIETVNDDGTADTYRPVDSESGTPEVFYRSVPIVLPRGRGTSSRHSVAPGMTAYQGFVDRDPNKPFIFGFSGVVSGVEEDDFPPFPPLWWPRDHGRPAHERSIINAIPGEIDDDSNPVGYEPTDMSEDALPIPSLTDAARSTTGHLYWIGTVEYEGSPGQTAVYRIAFDDVPPDTVEGTGPEDEWEIKIVKDGEDTFALSEVPMFILDDPVNFNTENDFQPMYFTYADTKLVCWLWLRGTEPEDGEFVWQFDLTTEHSGFVFHSDGVIEIIPGEDEEDEDTTILRVPVYNSSTSSAGFIEIDVSDGSEVKFHEFVFATPPAGLEFPAASTLHAESITIPVYKDANQGMKSVIWRNERLLPARFDVDEHGSMEFRGILRTVTTDHQIVVPGLVASDQIYAFEAEEETVEWSKTGWDDFNADTEAGDEKSYERYTVINSNIDFSPPRVLYFAARYGYQHVPAFFRPIVVVDPEPDLTFWMVGSDGSGDTQDIEDETGNRIVRESFVVGAGGPPSNEIVTEFLSASPQVARESAFATDMSAVASDWASFTWDPDEPETEAQELLHKIEYFWRTCNLLTGTDIGEVTMASIDGKIVDGDRAGAEDFEKFCIEHSEPSGSATKSWTQTIDRTDPENPVWDDLPTDQDPLLPPGVVVTLRGGYYLRTGTVYVPKNIPDLTDPVPPGEGSIYVPIIDKNPGLGSSGKGYANEVEVDSYTIWQTANLGSDDSTEISFSSSFTFLLPEDIETPVDRIDVEWLIVWDEAIVHRFVVYNPKLEGPYQADYLPRWDAVNGVFINGKMVFGPGRRNHEIEEIGIG